MFKMLDTFAMYDTIVRTAPFVLMVLLPIGGLLYSEWALRRDMKRISRRP